MLKKVSVCPGGIDQGLTFDCKICFEKGILISEEKEEEKGKYYIFIDGKKVDLSASKYLKFLAFTVFSVTDKKKNGWFSLKNLFTELWNDWHSWFQDPIAGEKYVKRAMEKIKNTYGNDEYQQIIHAWKIVDEIIEEDKGKYSGKKKGRQKTPFESFEGMITAHVFSAPKGEEAKLLRFDFGGRDFIQCRNIEGEWFYKLRNNHKTILFDKVYLNQFLNEFKPSKRSEEWKTSTVLAQFLTLEKIRETLPTLP